MPGRELQSWREFSSLMGPGLKSSTSRSTLECLRGLCAQVGASGLQPSGTRAGGEFSDRGVALLIRNSLGRDALSFLTPPRLGACFGACRVSKSYARRCPNWRPKRSPSQRFEGKCQVRLSPKDGARAAVALLVRRVFCLSDPGAPEISARAPLLFLQRHPSQFLLPFCAILGRRMPSAQPRVPVATV
jgi:hypothetical protein